MNATSRGVPDTPEDPFSSTPKSPLSQHVAPNALSIHDVREYNSILRSIGWQKLIRRESIDTRTVQNGDDATSIPATTEAEHGPTSSGTSMEGSEQFEKRKKIGSAAQIPDTDGQNIVQSKPGARNIHRDGNVENSIGVSVLFVV